MLILGSVLIWLAFGALLVSTIGYLRSTADSSGEIGSVQRLSRGAYIVGALAIVSASLVLGKLLVSHDFYSDYVYQHTARSMSKLYWLPSFWAGQEGSFLLWAFWTSILGVVLAATSRRAEKYVMPVFNVPLMFLVIMLLVRSPFLPVSGPGGPGVVPPDGLGLNPNLENPWMVIHPPTMFLGFSSLVIPFSYAAAALFWRGRVEWLRRALPWGLFGVSVLGLAMMMGGYWAYEMLGWGGFWGWDPVENGPLVPWLLVLSFVHLAQLQRVRGIAVRSTFVFALLPYVMALYETFLTRTGILEKFSVHSFSTLGGEANNILLGVLLAAVALSVWLLVWRGRALPKGEPLDLTANRESAFIVSVSLLTVCAFIAGVGMSAPLLTQIGVDLHLATTVSSVKEDFFNKATYPVALLLAIGMGIGPHLAWRNRTEADTKKLVGSYAVAVVFAVGFLIISKIVGSALAGPKLIPQLILFTASIFAVTANSLLLFRSKSTVKLPVKTRFQTIGSHLAHIGAALILVGIACLVSFVKEAKDVALVYNRPKQVFDGKYLVTYKGQSGDYKTDKDNVLKFFVTNADGSGGQTVLLPFAMRSAEGSAKLLFRHPAIMHRPTGDLYLSATEGPDFYYPPPRFKFNAHRGHVAYVGPYALTFLGYERDPQAALEIAQTGQMPAKFPISAVVKVDYMGKSTIVKPQSIMYRDDPDAPDQPELKLPGGWLIAVGNINAGSMDMSQTAANEAKEFVGLAVRKDNGPPAEAFVLDITTRPMISLVWIGTIVLFIGGLLTLSRRASENRVGDSLEESAPEPAPDVLMGSPKKSRRSHKRTKPAPSMTLAKNTINVQKHRK